MAPVIRSIQLSSPRDDLRKELELIKQNSSLKRSPFSKKKKNSVVISTSPIQKSTDRNKLEIDT
jgi:hypothetical protein